MYERQVVHAIQHRKKKDFYLRYRIYNSEQERDEMFEAIKDQTPDICAVTLTITAESKPEQHELFKKENRTE